MALFFIQNGSIIIVVMFFTTAIMKGDESNMIRKYYGWFVYGNKEYVIRFRINGSLQWDAKSKCFIDKEMYVRSASEMICYAALGTHPFNAHDFGMALKISHDYFKELRGRGIPRWNPDNPVIMWD